MSLQINDELDFETPEEKNEYLKTRIESLGLSIRTQNALIGASIRSIGGIIRKSGLSLINIEGLGQKGLEEVKTKLRNSFEVRDKLQQAHQEIQPLAKNLSTEPSLELNVKGLIEEDDIVGAFARHFNVDKSIIESHTRRKDIVEIRDLATYFLREYANMSFPAIGKLIGGRDHTTIIHSYRKVSKNVASKVDFESEFSELIIKVRSIQERKPYIGQTIIPNFLASIGLQLTSRKASLRYKEMSERNIRVLELYRKGLTLENIGKVIKVSRERIRQIVQTTIRQMASNDSIAREITIDADVLIAEEKRKRNTLQRRIEDAVSRQNKEKRWSKYYIACKACGTTTIPHIKKGLCEQCAGHFRDDRREEIVRQHGNACDSCGLLRHEVAASFGRDFYITKDKRVYCQKCFLETTGKKLGGYKNYIWSRFFPECKSCGTTSVPHFRTGLCEKCGNKITDKERETLCNGGCNTCGLNRTEAKNKFGRDLYITKDGRIYCMKCFNIRKLRKQSKNA